MEINAGTAGAAEPKPKQDLSGPSLFGSFILGGFWAKWPGTWLK